MDMFDQGNSDDGPDTPTPTPPSSMTYEEIVKQMIHDEKQYQRDLHMIIHVFREELVKIVKDPKVSSPLILHSPSQLTCSSPSRNWIQFSQT